MLDQVLESQEKLMVNFNGKINDVYTDLISEIEAMNARLKKVEVEEILTRNTVQRHETYMQRRKDESLKHHVNAIMNDDFCQVVKEEKLQDTTRKKNYCDGNLRKKFFVTNL